MAREQWSDEVLFDPAHPPESGGAEDYGGDSGGGGGYTPPGDSASIGYGVPEDYEGDTGLGGGFVPPGGGRYIPPGDDSSLLKQIDLGYDPDWEAGWAEDSLLSQLPVTPTGSREDYEKYKEEQGPAPYTPIESTESGAEELADWWLEQQRKDKKDGDVKKLPQLEGGNWWDKYSDWDANSEFFTWLEQNKGMQFGAGFNFGDEDEGAWNKYWDEYQASLLTTDDGDDDDTNWWDKYSDTDTYSEFFTWLEQNKGMQFGAGFDFGNESEEAWGKYWDEYQASLTDDDDDYDDDDDGDDDDDDDDDDDGCFVAGTSIQTVNGIVPIEDVKEDDIVKSFDFKSNAIKDSKVTEIFTHKNHKYIIINGVIKTTSNHPFYSRGHWKAAGDLSIGDKILHVDGVEHTVDTIEPGDEPTTVYNLEVDGTHNYFAEGYLVHNKKKDWRKKYDVTLDKWLANRTEQDKIRVGGTLGLLGQAILPGQQASGMPNYMQQWQNLPTATPRTAVDQWSTLNIPTPPSSIYEPAPGLNFQDLMSNWAGYTPQAGGGGGLPFYSQGSMQELLRRLGGR